MVQVCFQGPLADPRVTAALFGILPPTRAGRIAQGALIGGDLVVPGVGTGTDMLDVVLSELSAPQLESLRYVGGTLGLVETARRVLAAGDEVAAVSLEPPTPDPIPWQDAEHLGWAAILAQAIGEILSYRATLAVSETASRLPMILSRAASRATAQAAPPKPLATGLGLADVTLHQRARPYSHYFTIEELTYSHTRFDGTQSDPVLRAVFMASDAVTVLPYDPVRDRVLLVEQVRAAPIARGDNTAWILEPVAGRIEPGHSPETTARKEAEEEAGLTLKDLHFIGDYYPSTGCFSEYLYSYIAIADLPDDAAGLGGVLAEGEDIRAHIMTRAELLARVEANEIPDAPLILSVYWLERNLARFRSAG